MNNKIRTISGTVLAVAALVMSAGAQAQSTDTSGSTMGSRGMMSGPNWYAPAGGRYVGLNVGRSDFSGGCGIGAFDCDDTSDVYSLYTGGMWNRNFGLELGISDFGDITRSNGAAISAYGFSIKGVGVMPLTESFGAFAKFGTMYNHTKTSPGIKDSGWGTTYGVGLNFDITPQLAAVLELDQTNMKFAGSREYINTTSIGLKYRF